MKKNSKNNSFKEFYDFFAKAPSINEKAWGIIHDFYHLILTTMEDNNITKADLARRLNKSRAAISQMFNKTPNVTIKKMVEIADAVGLEISIVAAIHKVKAIETHYTFSVDSDNANEIRINIKDTSKRKIFQIGEEFQLNTTVEHKEERPNYAQA